MERLGIDANLTGAGKGCLHQEAVILKIGGRRAGKVHASRGSFRLLDQLSNAIE